MSENLIPAESWTDGITQPDVIVNDNARRLEVISLPAASFEATMPGAPVEGTLYVLSAAWGDGSTHDLAYYFDAAFTYWTPYEGMVKSVAGVLHTFEAGAWASGGAGAGDVVGPASSTDNALPRFDGVGGTTLQDSGVIVSDDDEISGYRGNINAQTGTTYTFDAADSGKVITFSNASAITATLPSTLPAGWCCTWVQKGAGAVTFSAGSGATRQNRNAHTKSAGQWAMGTLYVDSNSGGSAAVYVLAGDTAA